LALRGAIARAEVEHLLAHLIRARSANNVVSLIEPAFAYVISVARLSRPGSRNRAQPWGDIVAEMQKVERRRATSHDRRKTRTVRLPDGALSPPQF